MLLLLWWDSFAAIFWLLRTATQFLQPRCSRNPRQAKDKLFSPRTVPNSQSSFTHPKFCKKYCCCCLWQVHLINSHVWHDSCGKSIAKSHTRASSISSKHMGQLEKRAHNAKGLFNTRNRCLFQLDQATEELQKSGEAETKYISRIKQQPLSLLYLATLGLSARPMQQHQHVHRRHLVKVGKEVCTIKMREEI